VLLPAAQDIEYDKRVEAFALAQLSNEEVRIRNAVADVLGVLATKLGPEVWVRCKELVCGRIKSNYVRSSSVYLLSAFVSGGLMRS
jgi:hypothetical protein